MKNLKDEYKSIDQEIVDAKNKLNEVASYKEKQRTNSKDSDEDDKIGDRVADKIAVFGGSWKFIITFCIIIFIWLIINSTILKNAFDPYPFILLNLVLSCLAAIQAPIIMMSQNRQEKRDRNRSEADYNINIKAESEITLIQKKLDLMMKQQEILMEHHHQQLNEVKITQNQISLQIEKLTNSSDI